MTKGSLVITMISISLFGCAVEKEETNVRSTKDSGGTTESSLLPGGPIDPEKTRLDEACNDRSVQNRLNECHIEHKCDLRGQNWHCYNDCSHHAIRLWDCLKFWNWSGMIKMKAAILSFCGDDETHITTFYIKQPPGCRSKMLCWADYGREKKCVPFSGTTITDDDLRPFHEVIDFEYGELCGVEFLPGRPPFDKCDTPMYCSEKKSTYVECIGCCESDRDDEDEGHGTDSLFDTCIDFCQQKFLNNP